ncbi:MAG: hypothetical protein J5896_05330 [Alphaproteobacteria bacterium]|nr:hypothetical protein [Alphaproteobacteria bacterium]
MGFGTDIVSTIKNRLKNKQDVEEPVRLTVSATKGTLWYEGHYVREKNKAGEIRFAEDSNAHMPYIFQMDRRTSRLFEKAMKYETQGSDSGVQAWMNKLVVLAQKYRSAMPMTSVHASYKKFHAMPLDNISRQTRQELKNILKDGIFQAQNNTIHLGVINRASMMKHHRRSQAFDVVYRDGVQQLQVTNVEHYTTNLDDMDHCQQISKIRYRLDDKINDMIADVLAHKEKAAGSLELLSGHLQKLSRNDYRKKQQIIALN